MTQPTRSQLDAMRPAPLTSRQIAELKRRQEAYKAAKCKTCCDHGLVGGPSYYAPDEGGEPCPDCNSPSTPSPLVGADGETTQGDTQHG